MGVRYDTNAKDEWDSRTGQATAQKYSKPVFDSILKKFLPIDSKKSCLEIGSIPGGFLVYLHKDFKYKITGVDFSSNTKVFEETMSLNNIKKYNFVKSDVFSYKPEKNFDVVCSFGFIEHFDNLDEVIGKHIKLLNKNGYLVISVPNFRKFQYVFRLIFDRKNLRIHNLKAMNPKNLERILSNYNMEKKYLGFLGGVQVWTDTPFNSKMLIKIRFAAIRFINSFNGKFPNSSYYSPYLLLIYKKS